MSTPTMRELCARAPQGQWKANCGTVSVDSPNAARRELVCAVCSPAGAAPEAWDGIGNRRHATAQFIARLSPETVMAVVEALETCRAAMLGKVNPSSQAWAESNHALALLNGTAPKRGEE